MSPHFRQISRAPPSSLIIKSGLSHCCYVSLFLMEFHSSFQHYQNITFAVHTTSKKRIDFWKDNDFWIVGTDVKFPNCVPKVHIIVCYLASNSFVLKHQQCEKWSSKLSLINRPLKKVLQWGFHCHPFFFTRNAVQFWTRLWKNPFCINQSIKLFFD
jgi:hypothetical protein